jgi:outer membrane immunogenic protein
MKKFLVAGIAAAAFCGAPALAADMPVKAPAYKAAAPVASWTGCYVGANAGYGWSEQTFIAPLGGIVFNKFTSDGGAIGGQIGCDYQSGAWVVGVQGLWDWSDINGRGNEFVDPFFERSNSRSFGTLTARLGYTLQPTTLLYVKGGAVRIKTHFGEGPIAIGVLNTADSTRHGWTVGGGLEHMFAPNWSAFIEYNYASFGGAHSVLFLPNGFDPNIRQDLQTILVGVNYRFGSWGKGPVVAKY